MKFDNELDVSDFNFIVNRSESYGRKNAIPEYLIEAARKAGKQYNELTGSFEPISTEK